MSKKWAVHKSGGGGGHSGAGNDRWLLTYADLITLLLVFFIVLYAISKVDEAKYTALAQYLKAAFSGGNMIVNTQLGKGDGVSVPLPQEIPPKLPAYSKPGDQPYRDVIVGIGKELMADFVNDGRFTVYQTQRGVTISLAGSAAFDSGKADIKAEFVPLLDAVAAKIATIANQISVEGFTDSDPISTPQFPSNWELSQERANQVRRYLQSKGVERDRFFMVGNGDARPAYSNATAEGKAKNRRVDIVILYNKQEPDVRQEIKADKQ